MASTMRSLLLGVLGDRRVYEPLIEDLTHGCLAYQCRVPYALGRLGDRRVFEPLINALGHWNDKVRQAQRRHWRNWGNRNGRRSFEVMQRTSRIAAAGDPRAGAVGRSTWKWHGAGSSGRGGTRTLA